MAKKIFTAKTEKQNTVIGTAANDNKVTYHTVPLLRYSLGLHPDFFLNT